MNPRVDLSKTNRFTVWEGGRFDTKTGQGSAYIVGGPEGQELDCLYVTNPTQYQWNCCFPAETGQVIAYAHVIRTGNEHSVSLELARVKACHTDIVQGQISPRLELETLFVYSAKGPVDAGVTLYLDQEHAKSEYGNLMNLAIDKAMTTQPDQRHFWGKQRVRVGS